jgi:predicted transcriptional regulator of viral defense system
MLKRIVVLVSARGSNRQKILEVFLKRKDFMTPYEAAELAEVNYNTARWTCLQLYKEGKLEKSKKGRGHYKYVG